MDRIVMEITTKEARKAALDALTDDFRILSGEGGEYAALAESALRNIAKVQEANDAGMIDQMRGNWTSLEKIGEMNQTLKDKTKAYLNQTSWAGKSWRNTERCSNMRESPSWAPAIPSTHRPRLTFLMQPPKPCAPKGPL